jgi:hypothetical protein
MKCAAPERRSAGDAEAQGDDARSGARKSALKATIDSRERSQTIPRRDEAYFIQLDVTAVGVMLTALLTFTTRPWGVGGVGAARKFTVASLVFAWFWYCVAMS